MTLKLLCLQVVGSEVCLETDRFSRNHYRLVTTTVNMERLTHPETADMHLVYGSVNGNGRAAVREYRKRFPNRRWVPQHQTF